eukprot:CAMPEP_0176443160 /NCGR_PEP_ID=MMETSP0127-20121128/22253_1 /TAXON_ID=938130 /ORGANISM="Platyophrya macrostoma, Strain WH" /LENGTH=131 /DNA_ID=CAMNT_0017828327 /DNA_START=49 /DNA_END=441 /DNA_ORIENTATION=+
MDMPTHGTAIISDTVARTAALEKWEAALRQKELELAELEASFAALHRHGTASKVLSGGGGGMARRSPASHSSVVSVDGGPVLLPFSTLPTAPSATSSLVMANISADINGPSAGGLKHRSLHHVPPPQSNSL